MDYVGIVLEVGCNALCKEANGSGMRLDHTKKMTEEG